MSAIKTQNKKHVYDKQRCGCIYSSGHFDLENTWYILKALTKSSTSPPSANTAAVSSLGFSLGARNCEQKVRDTTMTFLPLWMESTVCWQCHRQIQGGLLRKVSLQWPQTSPGRTLLALAPEERTDLEDERPTFSSHREKVLVKREETTWLAKAVTPRKVPCQEQTTPDIPVSISTGDMCAH